MPLPTRAVDASFDQLTVNEANCLKRASWPVYIQCLWTAAEQPGVRVVSLRTAMNAGLLVAGYISLNANSSGSWHVAQGRAGIPDDIWDALDFVAIDVELRGITISNIREAVIDVEALGKKAVIYTSWNAWNNYVIPSNSSALSERGVPLWNALWDKNPDFDFPTLRYGGWGDDQVFMEQWSGGTDVCGQFVDRNTIVNPELVFGTIHDDTVQPVQEILRQLLTMNVGIWGNFGGPVTLNELLHFAFHGSPTEHKELAKIESLGKLREAVVEANRTMASHLSEHATSGGLIDRVSGDALNRMADILDSLEQELRDAAGE